MARGGGNKKRFQYCTDPSGQEILYLRALQGNDFFEYIYHIGCAINLHSITNSGLIPVGQNLGKRQTIFFTSVDPLNKEHKDPETVDLKALRLENPLSNVVLEDKLTWFKSSSQYSEHQLADILTKGNFTRDEWNNLLHLCNIGHFSSVCCSQNFSSCQLPKNDGEMDATRNRRRENCGKVEVDVKPGFED